MISEEDKVRARRHMGYGAVQQAATFVLGIPAAVQTAFMIEGAWSRILPSSEALFRQYLDRLDKVEDQMEENMENLAAEAVGEIKVNLKEFDMLIQRYQYWQGALSNMLQVPANPFDQRWGGYGGGGGMNVPVTG